MFENSKKGWYGAYSLSGKITAEYFDEILHKDKVFNRFSEKKLKIKDFFEPDKVTNNIDYLQDNIKTFQIYEKQEKNFRYILSDIKPKNEKKIIKHFNNLNHLQKKEIKTNEIEKEYQLNYDAIFSKTLTGIKWNKRLGRQKPPNIIVNSNNYNKNNDIYFLSEKGKNYNSENNKCLVNMDNYTKRGEFIDLKDIRIRYDKPYNKKKLLKTQENQKNTEKNSSSHINSISSDNNISSYIYLFKDKIKKNKKKNSIITLKQSLSQNIKAPDFNKYLSRKYVKKIKDHKINNYISLLKINYNSIQEKIGSDIKFVHKKNINKIKKMKGINSLSLTDCYKYLDKYNNHNKTKALNMKLMPSRAYYENIKQKEKPNDILRTSKSSFYKNSFNNLINLKMISSPIFEKRKKDRKIIKFIDIIKNDMIFNDKPYEQLVLENDLNNLDGITFKSIKNKKRNNYK